jgi:hypothetical protein
LLRRVPDEDADPLELKADSQISVPICAGSATADCDLSCRQRISQARRSGVSAGYLPRFA